MIDHLIFDTSSFTAIDDTHSVGAYVRSGQSGALISHHAVPEAGNVSFVFVDADVTPGTDTIVEAAHGLVTGDKVRLTSSGTLPAGLALATDYYVIRLDSGSFKLAASPKDAERGIAVDITAAAGGGNHTLTEQESDRRALDIWINNPSLAITDGGGSITVDGTVELGATTLAALETITVLQGTSPWVVSATNLDIRDLDYTRDNLVVAGSTGNLMVVNADGSINVNADISVVNGSDKAEDSAHASGDIGTYILGVRQDVLASSTSADGDYASLKVDSVGALYVNVASSAPITVNDAALAATAIVSKVNPLNVADTAEAAVTSSLADRKYLWLYNNDNTKIYVGGSGVTAANGFPVSPGSYMELRAGAAVSPFFVGQTGKTPEIRTLELS